MARKKAPPHERAFLDDVAANGDDDTPRLVFADWLEDQGQPHRAELIRLQCRMAALDELEPEAEELGQREWELVTVLGPEWRRALPAWAAAEPATFRRGFIDRISVTLSSFLKNGPALFAAAPMRDLHLRVSSGRWADLAASPLLRRLAGLDLQYNVVPPDAVAALTASPHLDGLTALTLKKTHLSPDAVRVLVEWPGLARLGLLDLSGNGLTAESIEALARSAHPRSLRWLNLADHRATVGSIRALADSPALAGLTHLDLSEGPLDADHFAALTAGDSLPALTSLAIRSQRSGDGLLALARSSLLPRLISLDLAYCSGRLPPAVVREMAHGGGLAGLRRLRLDGTRIADDAVAELPSSPLGALVSIDLANNPQLGAEGVRALAASVRPDRLRWLDLSHTIIGDDGARALADSPQFAGLTRLRLIRVQIGPAGAAALAASPYLRNLRSLELGWNNVGPDGIKALAASENLRGLWRLDVMGTGGDESSLAALARSPNLGNLRRLKIYNAVPKLPPDAAVLKELANSPRLPKLMMLYVWQGSNSLAALRALGREVTL